MPQYNRRELDDRAHEYGFNRDPGTESQPHCQTIYGIHGKYSRVCRFFGLVRMMD